MAMNTIYPDSVDSSSSRDGNEESWMDILKPMKSGSASAVAFIANYGPTLQRIGSSSLVIDCRPILWNSVEPEISNEFDTTIDQMQELLAALSINKSQLARILRVSRPTIYEWFQGKDPNSENTTRLQKLIRLLSLARISSSTPLNARFVRQPIELGSSSIIDLLSVQDLNEDNIKNALRKARELGIKTSNKRVNRENQLRKLGFEDASSDERRENLARNIALKDWPS